MQIRYLGHSAIEIISDGHRLLIDPFLQGNPLAPVDPRDLSPDFILLSHFHGDHLGDTVSIARRTGALVISTNEIAVELAGQGLQTHGLHIGGRRNFPFGELRLIQATHGAGIAGGLAAGLLLTMEEKKIYHAGDTGLYSDLGLLRKPWGPCDVAMLPIGGNYTMDVRDAVRAVDLIRPALAIPIHFNTFPLIQADPSVFRQEVEQALPTKVRILAPGDTLEL